MGGGVGFGGGEEVYQRATPAPCIMLQTLLCGYNVRVMKDSCSKTRFAVCEHIALYKFVEASRTPDFDSRLRRPGFLSFPLSRPVVSADIERCILALTYIVHPAEGVSACVWLGELLSSLPLRA